MKLKSVAPFKRAAGLFYHIDFKDLFPQPDGYGVWTGDDPPTASRDDHHGFFPQSLQGKFHGDGGPATGATQMPRVHQIVVP